MESLCRQGKRDIAFQHRIWNKIPREEADAFGHLQNIKPTAVRIGVQLKL